MAAAVVTAAGTLEAQVLEVCTALQIAELAIDAETRPDNVNITPNLETGTVEITVSLPATFAPGAGGTMVISATEYMAA